MYVRAGEWQDGGMSERGGCVMCETTPLDGSRGILKCKALCLYEKCFINNVWLTD